MDKKFLAIALLGLGGVVLYFITRPREVAPSPAIGYPTYPAGAYQYPIEIPGVGKVYIPAEDIKKYLPYVVGIPLLYKLFPWLGGQTSKIEQAV